MAVTGAVRLSSDAPWTQRRRIVGMVKSPVEGSTAALIRLEAPIIFSDFVRPVCLPDDTSRDILNAAKRRMDEFNDYENDEDIPKAEKFEATPFTYMIQSKKQPRKINENTQYFVYPEDEEQSESSTDTSDENHSEKLVTNLMDESNVMPKAEAVIQNETESTTTYMAQGMTMIKEMIPWTQCNTIGWSRQRDHLQRVQLKIGDMGACENISIATVNSLCTEALFHQQDCSVSKFLIC